MDRHWKERTNRKDIVAFLHGWTQTGLQRQTFTKDDKIRKRQDFLRLSPDGYKAQNKEFIAIFKENQGVCGRLGLTVSKRVGNAVKRNRTKRIVREYYRRNRHHLIKTIDINIIARQPVASLETDRIFHSLHGLFDKINHRIRH